MRRPYAVRALLACLAFLAGSLVAATPSVAYACGFGSSTGGSGTNPTVSTDLAHTPTPSSATLIAAISNLGSTVSCRGYLTTADASPWTVPSDWVNTSATVELLGPIGVDSIGEGEAAAIRLTL